MARSGFAASQLRSLIQRVERLEEERAAIAADVREIYAEAKGQGFDTKIMKMVIKLRKLDKADRQEQEALLDLYLSALGERDGGYREALATTERLARDVEPGEPDEIPGATKRDPSKFINDGASEPFRAAQFDPETGEITEPHSDRRREPEPATAG